MNHRSCRQARQRRPAARAAMAAKGRWPGDRATLGLLVAVEAGPPDALRAAGVEHLRGQIAFDQHRAGDAVRLLLSAASRLEPLDVRWARETALEALVAAMWAGELGGPGTLAEAAKAGRAAPPGPEPPRRHLVRL